MKLIAIFVLLLTCCLPAIPAAQNNFRSFQHLTVKDGLSQSSVVSIAQDSTGFVWLATQDGLNRYDGRKFIYFEKYFDDITNTQTNRLGKVYVDKKNNVWIIPNTRIPEIYNRFTKTFKPLPELQNITNILNDKKGNYWFGAVDGAVTRIDGSNHYFSYKTILSTINTFFEDSKGRLWLGSRNGMYRYNEDSNTFMPVTLPYAMVNIYCITEDSTGNLWAGSLGNGLWCMPAKANTFQPFEFTCPGATLNSLPSSLIIESIETDDENRLWLGTYGNGLIVVNGINKTGTQYLPEKENPFSFNYKDVLTICKTKDHLLWMGTDGGGVNLYDKSYNWFRGFTVSSVPQGIAVDIVRCIYKDNDNNTWLGTSGKGLTRYNPDLAVKWKTFVLNKNEKATTEGSNRMMCLYDADAGHLWVGTQGDGMLVFDKRTEKFISWPNSRHPFPDHTVWCMYPAGEGNVWAGTQNNGLCLLDKKGTLLKQAMFATDNNHWSPIKNIRCIEKINDTILFAGTDENGLYSYNINTNIILPVMLPGKTHDKLLKIKSLYYNVKSSLLFIGTNGNGLAIYNTTTMDMQIYNTQQGLPNNVVYGIVPGINETLWLSTNKGICSFSDYDKAGKAVIHLYDDKDGLQSPEFNTGAYFKDEKGYIYFGGIYGYNYFYPPDITGNPSTGNIVFTECTIAGKPYNNDSAIETKHLLVLNAGENEFSVSFSLLNYSLPRQTIYQYQLQGYDKRLVNAGLDNTANYTNLSPGLYTLIVTAKNNDGTTIHKPASLSILVKPAFYQEWLFKIMAGVCLVGLIYWFVRWRIQSVRKQEQLKQMRTAAEMKALRAQMNPHFIFNCLNAIDNLIQTNQKDKATTYLARFAKLIRNVLDSSKNNLVPFTKDIDTLQLYLSLEQFRFNNKFSFTIQVTDELLHADYKVPPLLIQPFVENAIHHGLMNKSSEDKKLEINIQLENDFIKYIITDNGIGRKSSAALNSINKPEHISYGIQISEERARLHNNTSKQKTMLTITDLEKEGQPAGTSVEIWVSVL